MYLRLFPIAGFHKNPIMCYTGVLHQTENSPKYIVISRKKCTADVKWYICKNSKYNLKYGFLLKKQYFVIIISDLKRLESICIFSVS